MSNWAHAIGKGLQAGAKAGSDALDQQMKTQAGIDAEQRAANLKLDMASRMMAIEEAQKNRAAERYSKVAQQMLGEQIPVAAKPVSETGITHEAGIAVGLKTGGLQMDAASMEALKQQAQDTIESPGATKQQKDDAAALLAQIDKQVGAQGTLNASAVAGKTRNRTEIEAARAAMEKLIVTDLPAAKAAQDVFGTIDKGEREDAKLASKERIAKEEGERNERIAERERMRRESADVQRHEDSMSRLEVMMARSGARAAAGSKSGSKSALIQNVEFMRDKLGYSPEKIESFIFDKKTISKAELTAKLLADAKKNNEDVTPEQAATMADSILSASAPAAKTAATPKRLKYNAATGKVE